MDGSLASAMGRKFTESIIFILHEGTFKLFTFALFGTTVGTIAFFINILENGVRIIALEFVTQSCNVIILLRK